MHLIRANNDNLMFLKGHDQYNIWPDKKYKGELKIVWKITDKLINIKNKQFFYVFQLWSLSAYPIPVQCQHKDMVKKMLAQFTSQTTFYLLATSLQEKLCLTHCYNYFTLAYLLFSNKQNVYNMHWFFTFTVVIYWSQIVFGLLHCLVDDDGTGTCCLHIHSGGSTAHNHML